MKLRNFCKTLKIQKELKVSCVNKILFLICLPFKIFHKLLGLTNSVFKNLIQFAKLWILLWFLDWFNGLNFMQGKFLEMQGKYYQMQYITKQKICSYIDCEIKNCNESVCVY